MPDDRSYEDDEVRAILDRALAARPKNGLSHDDLLAVGEGVGLSKADMEAAARQVAIERVERDARDGIIAKRRRWFGLHAGLFGLVNGFLFLINFLTTPGEWWVLFPVFIWGFALALHALFGLSKPAVVGNKQRLRIAAPAPEARAEAIEAESEEVGETRPNRATLPK